MLSSCTQKEVCCAGSLMRVCLLPFAQVAELVTSEFFEQGDRERSELKLTPSVSLLHRTHIQQHSHSLAYKIIWIFFPHTLFLHYGLIICMLCNGVVVHFHYMPFVQHSL